MSWTGYDASEQQHLGPPLPGKEGYHLVSSVPLCWALHPLPRPLPPPTPTSAAVHTPADPVWLGGPKIALRGGDGMGARRRRGGGGFQKWASMPGPLFCVRTDVAAKGAGTQILAWKIFFHENIFPHTCVVKMISATWGSF